MKLFLPIFLIVLTLSTTASAHVSADSIPGRLIKTITTRGQFVRFDKDHADRFFIRDASDQMVMNCVMTDTETDLFLADHAKDDLKLTYQVRDVTIPGGKMQWLNYAMSIRSLKTGADEHSWPQKLANDSTLLQSSQTKLRELRGEE
jgi:hypothetical protein